MWFEVYAMMIRPGGSGRQEEVIFGVIPSEAWARFYYVLATTAYQRAGWELVAGGWRRA